LRRSDSPADIDLQLSQYLLRTTSHDTVKYLDPKGVQYIALNQTPSCIKIRKLCNAKGFTDQRSLLVLFIGAEDISSFLLVADQLSHTLISILTLFLFQSLNKL